MKVTIVDFTGEGDGFYALYIDDKLHRYGDNYHDKIQCWIKAFIEGLKYAGIEVSQSDVKIWDEEMIENISGSGEVPPKNLKEIKI